ncbi:MAG: DUF2723 domain-containing protein [Planctomycetota bacterium]
MTTQESPVNDAQRRWIVAATFLFAILLYALTCSPGVLWQDSGMFQFRVWHGDLAGDLGLPLAHPLYILLAKAFTVLPFGPFAYRVNLFSAVCGAACLAVTMDLLLSLTRCRIAAVGGTILLAVSHTFWTHAVIAEVYELYALTLVAELWLLNRYFRRFEFHWLAIALLVNGLSTANHLFAILHLPAYAGIILWGLRARRIRPGRLWLPALAWIIGTLPYTVLVASNIVDGQPLCGALKEALVGPPNRARHVLAHTFPFARQAGHAVQYFAMNFPTPLALLAPVGLWSAWRRPQTRWFAVVAGTIFVIAFVFAFRYLVPDQYVFFIPCYVLFALFVGLAIPRLLGQSAARRTLCLMLAVLPVAVYEFAPRLLKDRQTSIGVKRHIPPRDSYVYFIRPRKNGEDSASRFARAALEQAAPDGLLIADTTIKNALAVVRDVERTHQSVALTTGGDITPAQPMIPLSPDAVRPFVERGTAYVCSESEHYVPEWIREKYDLVPAGVVFRLEER